MKVFERLESNVQSYARSFPVTFERAHGALLYDTEGNRYLDFLAGAGSLIMGITTVFAVKHCLIILSRAGLPMA